MSRTANETMRELNDPIPVHFHIGDPEPRLTPLAMVDLEQLHAGALVLIQRLDRTIVDQEKLAKKIYDQKVEAETKIVKLEDRVKQLETERDALINEIDTYQHPCDCCKHAEKEASKEPCTRCKQIFKGRKSHFEWRGVTKEE